MKQFLRFSLRAVLPIIGLLWQVQSKAQCNFSINLQDSITLCKNSSVLISPSLIISGSNPDFLDTTWTPASGLSNADTLSPTLSVGINSAYYILTVQGITANNLILNGDFSLGNTIFSSSYIYGTGGPWGLLSNEGQYAIDTDPHNDHINFASFGDHTTGTGNMMVVNGAATANVNIWCQTIAVQPNTNYDFSAWGASCVASNPAILQFSINGTLIGTALSLPTTTGVWTPFHATWFSGSNTSITICITDQATAASGNDFAIDDIAFRQICNVSDSVYVHTINLTPSILSMTNLGCLADSVQFTADPGTGTLPTGYQWSFGDGQSSGLANPLHIYASQSVYTIKLITSNSGCSDSASVVIQNQHPLQAAFNSPDTACVSSLITCQNLSSATGPFHSFWDHGNGQSDTSGQLLYMTTGTYVITLTITDTIGCSVSMSRPIQILNAPSVRLPQDTTICEGDAITLHAVSSGPPVQWQDGSGGSTFQTQQAGVFYASVINFCGQDTDSITVSTRNCTCHVSIPNAFSPNGDGVNDLFHILYWNCDISNFDLLIFNRWGEELFHSTDPDMLWDGTYKGREQEGGTYFYFLQYYSTYTGLKYEKGDLILIR